MKTDPLREGGAYHEATGIYIRAIGQDGKWGAFDIAELDAESLTHFLTSRGGGNPWAENTVRILLGHPTENTVPDAGEGRCK